MIFCELSSLGTRWYVLAVWDPQLVRDEKKLGTTGLYIQTIYRLFIIYLFMTSLSTLWRFVLSVFFALPLFFSHTELILLSHVCLAVFLLSIFIQHTVFITARPLQLIYLIY